MSIHFNRWIRKPGKYYKIIINDNYNPLKSQQTPKDDISDKK